MAGHKISGLLLDIDTQQNENEESFVKVYIKTGKGIEWFVDERLKPYLFVIASEPEKVKKQLLEKEFEIEAGRKVKLLSVEGAKKANSENVLKLVFKNTSDLSGFREQLKGMPGIIERREYDIPFAKRYLVDMQLSPMAMVEAEIDEKGKIKGIKKSASKDDLLKKLSACCFDLETLSPGRFSDPKKDAIVMVSYADEKESIVYTWRKAQIPYVKCFPDEKSMLQAFIEKVKQKKPDLIVTYNGDRFDFPYLKERCHKLGLKFNIGADGSDPSVKKRGLETAVKIRGIQHLDAYQMVRILARIGAVGLIKFDLESVYEVIFGQKKYKVKAEEINQIWETGEKFEYLAQYNKEDAEAALKIALEYLQLFVEISKLVGETLFEVSRSSTGQFVEYLLINKAFRENLLIANRPSEGEVKQRLLQSFKGGYVKEPTAGLHENIAVLDFRSLHPTIMISHNISPETLNCKCCEKTQKNLCPTKDWFCEKRKGFVSSALDEILRMRFAIKDAMKKAKKDSHEYKTLHARQHALKIILNSFYGTLGYARFRWYSRECARAVTAWSRHYIREVGQKAEAAGFKNLYSDTDSNFLLVPQGKSLDDVKNFLEKINKELPDIMELEFENFYKRGIFVTKKEGGAAKKRYALVDFDGNLKIVGFEYVRRDWAVIAKKTQRDVIEAVLKEGNPQKAIEIVKQKIAELKAMKVPKEDLIIMTQIKKPLKKYEAIGPHVAAALKAVQRGKEIDVGSVISFIVTRNGKSISDKAELEEYVQPGNYDPDYYIENQLVPAVIHIMRELGYERDDLIQGGKQSSLSSFS